ncbi:hypothetical protein D3C84_719930 [compost metagenome]
MTNHVGDATDDLIGLAVLATGDSITIASMGDAIHHDSGIAIQDLATTGGLVIKTNEISLAHRISSSVVEGRKSSAIDTPSRAMNR